MAIITKKEFTQFSLEDFLILTNLGKVGVVFAIFNQLIMETLINKQRGPSTDVAICVLYLKRLAIFTNGLGVLAEDGLLNLDFDKYTSIYKLWSNTAPSPIFLSNYVIILTICIKSNAMTNQRTNSPVNAHLISWNSKAQNKQNLENIW